MEDVHRLNYIGSKFQLLDWLQTQVLESTGWNTFENKKIADIFAGTGIVSYKFRLDGAIPVTNDAELYSSIIAHAFARSCFTAKCEELFDEMDGELVGFITTNYSPHEGDRMFFTVENAKRIDFIRQKLFDIKDEISDDEYKFMLASLILAADAVSNVPAVYGCYLKNFKKKALNKLKYIPIHTNKTASLGECFNGDVLAQDFGEVDMVYLDPPYNERQYSKNYFPLNMIAMDPNTEVVLGGKTGIPEGCFISPFCSRKKDIVDGAFDNLIKNLKSEWIFLSYSSEGTVPEERMLKILSKYGDVNVIKKDYKRFKSFEYNEDLSVVEFLFCLQKTRTW
jgi:adenine-specific DNA-methyltransferase